jgi:predicted nuclease of predicted toxin-antitoxin system
MLQGFNRSSPRPDRRVANPVAPWSHDLDFGALLALTRLTGPSVVQVRTQDVSPEHLASLVVAALRQHAEALDRGALVTIDEARARVRVLPIRAES